MRGIFLMEPSEKRHALCEWVVPGRPYLKMKRNKMIHSTPSSWICSINAAWKGLLDLDILHKVFPVEQIDSYFRINMNILSRSLNKCTFLSKVKYFKIGSTLWKSTLMEKINDIYVTNLVSLYPSWNIISYYSDLMLYTPSVHKKCTSRFCPKSKVLMFDRFYLKT